MCVTSHALLSALVRRIERESYAVTRRELETLLRAGCTREDIVRGLERGTTAAFEDARRLLATIES